MKASRSFLLVALLSACPSRQSGDTVVPLEESQTLYSQIGGIESIRRLVDEWMLEAGGDERIQDFFAGTDISQHKLRLVERLCVLTEGPCMYRGRKMYEVHAVLHLDDKHVRAFLEGLKPAMQRAEIEPQAARELERAIRGLATELGIGISTSR